MLGRLKHDSNPVATHAIKHAVVSADSNGNLRLDRATSRGRIDWLSAAVIAVGIGHEWRVRTGGEH